ncbi:sulfotransferase, partial [Planktotalea sp.]|uniref:sulfotransferase family protein n=1 Tax=Planktotalea sp. TaxID=2029877 RepID=UPI0032969F11
IFIVGMIRSGTTLLERMLSGHDEIGPLGEVSVVGRAIDTAIHEGQDLKPTIAGLAKRYEPYQNVAGDVRFTTDKMPNNYLYIGFLRQAFPDCKIILVKRDFRDIAVSAFETYFDSPALNFSYTEAGILNRLKLFENMSSYWEAMGDICTVWYEDLVSEPERVLQSVADYCGFELQPEMTQPQRSTTAIRTASHSQARQPLYASSQKRWQDDVCAQYLPSIVNDADNTSIAWRVAWLNDMQRRSLA